jgi:hypothetical protein
MVTPGIDSCITFVLFLSAILKIYAVSFINVSQALITKFGRMSSETEGRAKREKIEERRGVKSTSRDGLLTNGYALFGFGFRVMPQQAQARFARARLCLPYNEGRKETLRPK